MEVTCPSGLRGEVREWVLGDEDVLAEAFERGEGAQATAHIETLIVDSWTRTIDPGPYGKMDRIDLAKILAVDLVAILLKAREATWGSEVLCDPPCPGGAHAAEGIADTSKCEVRRITAEGMEYLRAGRPILVKLPRTGRTVGLNLQTRTVERELAEAMAAYPKDRRTRRFMGRLTQVEGFSDPATGVDIETKMPLYDWMKRLPGADRIVLSQKLEEIDPKIDTEAMVKCGVCGATALAEVTLQADFFVPSGRAQALIASSSFSSRKSPS